MISHGWDLFLKEPVLGYGLNNFSILFAKILGEGYAHNNYIELLVDLGMIGTIAYYSFYAFIIGKLIGIRNDLTGLRNFFLAFMLVLLVFDIGNVTYQYPPVQIFIGLASAFVWLEQRNRITAS
jgi:O-antigen ligase